ncbi:MAG: hypothetical protein ACOYXM_08985 [Actinomycetota bacterium]
MSDTTPSAGDTVTVSGTGAEPNGTVTASLDGAQVGSGTATGAGAFSFSATIPSTATGTETLSVDCVDSGSSVLSLTLTVTPAAVTTTTAAPTTTTTVAAAELARTGSNSSLPMTQIALATLAVGGLVLGAARMRKRAVQKSSL